MKENSRKKLTFFARLGTHGYMAGTNRDAIKSYAKLIFPEIPDKEIRGLPSIAIPNDHYWSAARVMEFDDWRVQGSYLLLKDFETSEGFTKYFSRERLEARTLQQRLETDSYNRIFDQR